MGVWVCVCVCVLSSSRCVYGRVHKYNTESASWCVCVCACVFLQVEVLYQGACVYSHVSCAFMIVSVNENIITNTCCGDMLGECAF